MERQRKVRREERWGERGTRLLRIHNTRGSLANEGETAKVPTAHPNFTNRPGIAHHLSVFHKLSMIPLRFITLSSHLNSSNAILSHLEIMRASK